LAKELDKIIVTVSFPQIAIIVASMNEMRISSATEIIGVIPFLFLFCPILQNIVALIFTPLREAVHPE